MKMVNRKDTFAWKLVAVVLSLVIVIAIPIECMAAGGLSKGSTAYVNVEDYLHLRKEPQGEIIGKAPRGEKVTILSGPDRNHYYYICVQSTGLKCYAYGQYLTSTYIEKPSGKKVKMTNQAETAHSVATSKPKAKELHYDMDRLDRLSYEGKVMYVISQTRLNLRKGPSLDSSRIRFLERGEIVIVTEEKAKNGFVKVIAVSDGKEGYAYKSYLSTTPPDEVNYIYDECPCQYLDLGK